MSGVALATQSRRSSISWVAHLVHIGAASTSSLQLLVLGAASATRLQLVVLLAVLVPGLWRHPRFQRTHLACLPHCLPVFCTLPHCFCVCTGGASLSLNSLQAGLIGAAAAAPLVAYKLFSWTPPAQQENPTLAALKRAQIDISRPWLSNMNREQLAAHVVLDTLPLLFLMLPAAQAGLTASFYWTSQAIGRSTGLQLPEEVGCMLVLIHFGCSVAVCMRVHVVVVSLG